MAVSKTDAVWLMVAVAAVSTSAPLIREAAAPALAVAFWRNSLAAAALVPIAAGGRARGASAGRAGGRSGRDAMVGLSATQRRPWWLAVGAGVLLAAHFAAWIPSLSLTTVSASVALVTTQPVWTALLAGATGAPVGRKGWLGIGLALGGVVLVTGVDVGSSGRAAVGDLLALAGGVLAAAYISVGAAARRHLSTTDYTACCYSVAAVVLLGACLVGREPIFGFGLRTWLCLIAITVGPQLLGHSVFSRVVPAVGPTVVSMAIVAELVGAALLALWWFGESPSPAIVPAAMCIVAGVVLVVRSVASAGPAPEAPTL